MKVLQKFVNDSLSFLDNDWVRLALFLVVIFYIVGVLPMLTDDVLYFLDNPLVKLVVLVFIVYVALKDLPLALLLALAFVLSLVVGYKYNFGFHLGPGLSAGVDLGARSGHTGLPSASVKAEAEAFNNEDGDKVVGGNYSHYNDCVKNCADGSTNTLECKGVATWDDELNAQGLNCPGGYSGNKLSPF
jgi:hypothetical protein